MKFKISENTFSNLEITVHKVEHVLLDDTWVYVNAHSPYTRLYFVKDGDGELRYGEKTVKLQKGKVYMIPADLVFSYSCKTLEKIFFHLSLINKEGYDVLSGLKDIFALDFEEEKFLEMKKSLENPNYYSEISINSIFFSTLVKFFEKFSFSFEEIKTHSELVAKVISFVQKNPTISLSVEDLARENFVSVSKLRNLFLRETGITIGKYVDDMVFMRAKLLLSDKTVSIAEISRRLDFCDQFYFSRRFREKFGVTPTQFRRAIS